MYWVKDIQGNKIIFDNDYSIVVNEPEEILLAVQPPESYTTPRSSAKSITFGTAYGLGSTIKYELNPIYYPFCRKVYRVQSNKHLISEYNHPYVAGVYQYQILRSYKDNGGDLWIFDYTKSNKYEYELLSSIKHLKRFSDFSPNLGDLSTDLMTIGNLPIIYEWVMIYKNGSLREYGLTDNQYNHIAKILEGFYKENVLACTKYIFLRQTNILCV